MSRYFHSLIQQYFKDTEIDILAPLLYTENAYFGKTPSWMPDIFCNYKSRVKSKLAYELNGLYSRKVISRGDYDIFHPTYYNPYFLEVNKQAFVITVYDMIHELFPQYFSNKDKSVEWKKQLVFEADKVIAISNNTKKDIMDIYGIDANKVEVIHLASDLSGGKKLSGDRLPEEYILFVGNRDHYKNFLFFVSSLAPILLDNKKLYLVCAGGGSFKQHELEKLSELRIQDKTLQLPFDDALLADLYYNACAFVFPSLYEGFGIPVLEALNNDCIPILCNRGSLPEVGSDAALYFEAGDEDSLREAVLLALQDGYKESMLPVIRARAAQFSWEKTAFETKNVYQQLLADKGSG